MGLTPWFFTIFWNSLTASVPMWVDKDASAGSWIARGTGVGSREGTLLRQSHPQPQCNGAAPPDNCSTRTAIARLPKSVHSCRRLRECDRLIERVRRARLLVHPVGSSCNPNEDKPTCLFLGSDGAGRGSCRWPGTQRRAASDVRVARARQVFYSRISRLGRHRRQR